MFVILLKFSDNKASAAEHMDAHNRWLKQGFDDGVYLLAGSIEPGQGGSILAVDASGEALQARVDADPFVIHDIVAAEIIQISPKKADERLSFLVD